MRPVLAQAMQAAFALLALLCCCRGVQGFGLVTVQGGAFHEDGRAARYAGTNALSLAQFADAPTRQDLLARMVRANLTLLRLWAFSDGESCAPAPRQNYLQCWDAAASRVVINETGLALHLDGALAAASRAGVHVILSLVNNWPAYGGMAAYVQWREAAAAAGAAPPTAAGGARHDDFYVDETMRGWYRAWVTALTGRVNSVTGVAYRDDPTIFAWELGNELACTNSSAAHPCVAANGTSPPMRAWVAEMSGLIKGLDSNHMVAIGDEGFWGLGDTGGVPCPAGGGPAGRQWWCSGAAGDWLGLLRLPGIDFASLHMYPDSFNMGSWGLGSEDDVARGWVANHTRQAHALGKPLLMGEFGNGAAQLAQHTRYAVYTQAAAEAGTDGWAVWMLAGLEGGAQWPSWWRGGDAALQVYCLQPGDPALPSDGGFHDPGTCAVLAAAASRL